MAEEEKPKSWWVTLPGVITSLAAAITAVGGLMVALKQTGWLDDKAKPAEISQKAPAPDAGSVVKTHADTSPAKEPTANEATPNASTNGVRTVELPVVRDYTLQEIDYKPDSRSAKATFTILKAELKPKNNEAQILKIRARVMNHGRIPMNFWGDLLRLVESGAPREPDAAPNETLATNAAKDDDYIFTIPRNTNIVALRFLYAGETIDIPLNLSTAR